MKRNFSARLLAGTLAGLVVFGLFQAEAGEAGRRASKRRVVPARNFPNDLYRLQPGDELEVTVWGMTEFNRKAQLREDGTLPFPGAGALVAAGRTLPEIEEEIAQVLSGRRSFLEEESETAGVVQQAISAKEIPDEPYRIRSGDELDVSVWGQTDLNRKAVVGEDGNFSFPLIGLVQTADRPLKEVEEEIRERLNRDFVVNPQVTARLSGAKVSVLGDVATAGPHSLEETVDLLTAITQAGGALRSGPLRAEILRRHGEKVLVIEAHPDAILAGLEPNITLMPHDTIFVRAIPFLDETAGGIRVLVRVSNAKFSVLGDVQRPGIYPIAEGTTDLLSAISQAGGVTKFGSNKVDILREQGEELLTLRANLGRILQGEDPNVTILPRDTIHVRRRLF